MYLYALIAADIAIGPTMVGATQVVAEYELKERSFIEASDLHRSRNVIKTFFRENRPGCYRVSFVRVKDDLRLSFISKRRILNIVREGEVVSPDPYAHCGRSVTYLLDANGKVRRKIFPK